MTDLCHGLSGCMEYNATLILLLQKDTAMENDKVNGWTTDVQHPVTKVNRSQRERADRCPVQNEDHAKYGAGHTQLTLEVFLTAEANNVPNTSLWTWRWWGEDYYAQRKEQFVHVTLHVNDSLDKWLCFSPQDLMDKVYKTFRIS